MPAIVLPSGRSLEVGIAPLQVAGKLRRTVAAELLKVDVQIDALKLDANLDLSKVDSKTLNTIKNVICTALASEAVENGFFECAIRSTIDGEKVTRDSFERPETRGDLIPAAGEVIRANLAPFFAGLDLSLLSRITGKNNAQPSKSA